MEDGRRSGEVFVGGVTGTNGKTSVVEYARQALALLGRPTATLGSLGLALPGGGRDPDPGVIDLAGPAAMPRFVEDTARRGAQVFLFEAFSKALRDGIHDALSLDAAVFTNLSREHLDEHPSFEEYLQAKLHLFELVESGGWAIVNVEDRVAPRVVEVCRENELRIVGVGEGGDLTVQPQGGGRIRLRFAGRATEVPSELRAPHELSNLGAALALAAAVGATFDELEEVLPELHSPPGRMERYELPSGAEVVIDHAHNPGGLEAVLGSLREETDGWLIVVLGAGGERDRDKRPVMGRVAASLADVVIVTDDNPRGEDPAAIRSQIMKGCPEAYEFADRREAIEAAMDFLEPGDRLLIAGKGAETGIEVDGRVIPHRDADVVRERLLWKPD